MVCIRPTEHLSSWVFMTKRNQGKNFNLWAQFFSRAKVVNTKFLLLTRSRARRSIENMLFILPIKTCCREIFLWANRHFENKIGHSRFCLSSSSSLPTINWLVSVRKMFADISKSALPPRLPPNSFHGFLGHQSFENRGPSGFPVWKCPERELSAPNFIGEFNFSQAAKDINFQLFYYSYI